MIGGKLPVEIKNLLKEKGVSEKDVVMFEGIIAPPQWPVDIIIDILKKILKEKGKKKKDGKRRENRD